jgi:hypothetical protein
MRKITQLDALPTGRKQTHPDAIDAMSAPSTRPNARGHNS